MNYYEVEFKLKVVNALIYNWKDAYQLFGKKGLETHRTPKTYTNDFKRDVLHFIETSDDSYGEAARQFKTSSGGMISLWQKERSLEDNLPCLNEKEIVWIMS